MTSFNPKKLALAGGITATVIGSALFGRVALQNVGAVSPTNTPGPATTVVQATSAPLTGNPSTGVQPVRSQGTETAEQPDAQINPTQAKITMDQAKQTALGKFPGGTVTTAYLDTEHGVLVWDVELTDAKGVAQDVTVDATSGQIVNTQGKEIERPEGPKQPEASKQPEAPEQPETGD